MFKKTKLVAGITLATATLISQQISAAGFAVNEQSSTASGTALAGNAASDTDISFSYWNPALFANATETTLYINGSYVAPSVDITNVSARDATTVYTTTNVGSDPVDDAIIPSIYLAVPVSDKTVLGVSLNVPYALKSEYDEDWAGRYHATNTELSDLSLSFSAAHRVNDWVDVGASIQIHSTTMTLDAAVNDFTGAATYGQGNVEVDDSFSLGYSLGIALEPKEGTRIGIGYRSEVDVEQTGDAIYTNLSATAGGAPYNVENASASANNTLPSLLTLSLEQELTDDLTLGLTAMRTGWSSIQNLTIDYDSNQPDSVLTLNYDDVWFYSAGLTYEYSDSLVLRTGYAIDNSPSDPNNLSPRAPGSDRQWITFGGTYNVSEETQIMFSYVRLTSDEVTVTSDGTGEDASRGTFTGDYDISANIFALAVNTTF